MSTDKYDGPQGKPGLGFLVAFNLTENLPLAIVMSLAAPLLSGQPIVPASFALNVLVAFVIATLLNLILPVQKMSVAVPSALHLDPHGIAGLLVGNVIPALIFVVVIGVSLTALNVIPHLPPEAPAAAAVLGEFAATALPLYALCFVVSLIMTPIALKAGMAADRH